MPASQPSAPMLLGRTRPSAPSLQEAQRQAAQEQLAETIAKTVEEMPPNIHAETKKEIVAQNIQEERQKLVSEGNLAALEPEVVTKAAADATVVTGKIETISKAAEDVTGVAESPRAEAQPPESLRSAEQQPAEEE
jgi:hypothetical protein